jgi:hypothetical protein
MAVTVLADRKNAWAGCHVARLAQPDIHQRARSVDGAIEVAAATLDFDVGFVEIPTPPDLAALAWKAQQGCASAIAT